MKFDYFEPKTVDEAVGLLQKYGDKARAIAGGTDLVVQMKDKVSRPGYIVSLAGIADLACLENDGGRIRIGPLLTMSSLSKSEEVKKWHPIVSQAAGQVSVAIRNMATVGGNICTASPAADSPPALIASGAMLRIVGPSGEREQILEEFFWGAGKTALGKSEIVTAIDVPAPLPRTSGVYLKYALKGSSDLSLVGVAALLTLSDDGKVCEKARIVLGAVAPTAIRARRAEEALEGGSIGGEIIEESARLASEDASPIDDVRASAEYRKEMTRVFTRRAINEAIKQARRI